MKLTTDYLESKGFYSKYKSCHVRWCKNGLCLDQASDEDDYGNSIEEKQEFFYDFGRGVDTIEELEALYLEVTGFVL